MDKFDNTLFCHKCDNFVMSDSGWRYGGSCKKWAASDNKEITDTNAGFDYCVDCMQRCKFITNNIVYRIYTGAIPYYWKYVRVPFNNGYNDQINKTIFLTEEDAKNKCNELMEENKKKREEAEVD